VRVFKLYEVFKKAQKFMGEVKLPNFKSELLLSKKMGKDRQFWPLTCRVMVRMHLELQTIKMREREEFALV
jgi:hypothetical protein